MRLKFSRNLQRPKQPVKINKKVITLRKEIILLNVKQKVVNSFEREYFPMQNKEKDYRIL